MGLFHSLKSQKLGHDTLSRRSILLRAASSTSKEILKARVLPEFFRRKRLTKNISEELRESHDAQKLIRRGVPLKSAFFNVSPFANTRLKSVTNRLFPICLPDTPHQASKPAMAGYPVGLYTIPDSVSLFPPVKPPPQEGNTP